MSKKELINTILSVILLVSIGLVSGYSLGYYHSVKASFPELTEVGEINPEIATLRFLTLENGLLKGEVAGQKARLAYSRTNVMDLEPGESFEIPIYQVTLGQYYSNRDLPKDAQFIASKSGKYYYSILNPKSFSITPKNRLFFNTAEEAKKEGYIPPKS